MLVYVLSIFTFNLHNEDVFLPPFHLCHQWGLKMLRDLHKAQGAKPGFKPKTVCFFNTIYSLAQLKNMQCCRMQMSVPYKNLLRYCYPSFNKWSSSDRSVVLVPHSPHLRLWQTSLPHKNACFPRSWIEPQNPSQHSTPGSPNWLGLVHERKLVCHIASPDEAPYLSPKEAYLERDTKESTWE